MAEAVQELFSGTQITFGPATEDGFYYDFHRDEPVSTDDFEALEKRMAEIVDRQNAQDPDYVPMCDNLDDNIAFKAALELVFEGAIQPSGYTEPVLHRRRAELKAARK